MKFYITVLAASLLILLTSCEKLPETSFGFSSAIESNSKGLTIASLPGHASYVVLEGSLVLSEGGVEVWLTNPAGEVVYTIDLHYPDQLTVNKSFNAMPGLWKLQYKSNRGIGTINLHVNY